jgi:hypothetical protein
MVFKDRLRTAYTASTDVVKLLAAGCVLQLYYVPVLSITRFEASTVYGILAAGLVFYSLDALIGCGLARVKYGAPLAQTLRESIMPATPSDVVSLLTVLGVAYSVVVFGPVAGLVLFAGSAGALASLHVVWKWLEENRALREAVARLQEERARLNETLLSSHLDFAARLVQSLGRKDGYTAAHAAASAVYAADMGWELGLEAGRVRQLEVAALLQNVGLVSVPDEVLLNAPERLNRLGQERYREHPAQSERLLSGVPEFEEAARWVRWHHERVDGAGYPDRLRADWIPLEARVLAVADTYAAAVLDGPSGPALSPVEARRLLTDAVGGSLDRGVVRTFLALLDAREEDYAVAAGSRFAFPGAPAASPVRAGRLRIVGE